MRIAEVLVCSERFLPVANADQLNVRDAQRVIASDCQASWLKIGRE